MTTITYPDISHKKGVPEKFNPNSYRVMTEEVSEHDNVPFWYAHSRPPPLYTNPNSDQLPAQASEARNNPHAARKVDMVFANATSFNAPFGVVKTDNVKKEEGRWWDWSQPKDEPYGPRATSQDQWTKTRESSYRNAFHMGGETGPYARKNTRYSANPHHVRTVGIVPITELKAEDFGSTSQTLVEKVSFEQDYNSRNQANYPLRGRRHGAFVVEDNKSETKPVEHSQLPPSTKIERAATMWDLFHPREELRGQKPSNPLKYRRPLPQIPRAEDYGQVWQTAPYANDFQFDYAHQPPSHAEQIDID